jgi:hypothetical protein
VINMRSPEQPRIPAALPVEPEPSSEHDPAELDAPTLALVRRRIKLAAQAYREHKPGQAEYHLVRAGLAIARSIDDHETAVTLSELRFVKIPGADK